MRAPPVVFALGVAALFFTRLAAPATSPPAFLGAEGFGSRTPGGRGGRVVFVRTLADAGPGSFREAVTSKGPRTVVFRVGGLITLESPIEITAPFLTIAGQTAPGDGICFRRNTVTIRTHDVVVRYLRFRPGAESGQEVDGFGVASGSRDVVIDHCSASWSVDEALSASSDVRDVTVQWCLIAEALDHSVHHKGRHGYGSLMRASGGVSLHHDLWAHNAARNPRLGDDYGRPPWPVFDVRNNVIYDYGAIASGMTGDRLSANYVGNYVAPGPSSDRRRGVIVLTDTASVAFHVSGNVVEGRPEWTRDNRLLFDRTQAGGRSLLTLQERPCETPPVRTTTAQEALREVLAGAGATRPRRDPVDARIVREVGEHGGRIIDSPQDVGGWPEYRSGPAPADEDEDGIPDDWERGHGLDPREAGDGRALRPDGYSNLEAYLEALAAGLAPDPGR